MSKLLSFVASGLLLTSVALFTMQAQAADTNTQQLAPADNQKVNVVQYPSSPMGVLENAEAHAKQEQTISFIIAFGPFEGARSPEELGQKLKLLAQEEGVSNAGYFIHLMDHPGYSVSATNGHTGTDVMSPKEMYAVLPKFAASTNRIYRQHLRGAVDGQRSAANFDRD